MVVNNNKVTVCESKRLSEESVKSPSTSDNYLNPGINHNNCNAKTRVKLNGSCLKRKKKSHFT